MKQSDIISREGDFMEVRDARCTNCGAQLNLSSETPITRCEYCQSELIVEHAIAFSKVQIDHSKDIQNYRQGLADAVRMESYQEILRLARQILDILPDDAAAEYFFAYGKARQGEPSFLRAFYQKRHVLTQEISDTLIAHIIRYGSLQDHTRIQTFIERHAPQRLDDYIESYRTKVLKEDQYAPVPRDVFICFSSYQKTDASFVNGALKRDGYSTWISLDNLRPNDNENYWKNIEEAIHLSRIVVVLASEQAMVSPDVQKEIQLAVKYKKPLIEIKLDDAPHTTLFKHAFDGNKWIDATSGVQTQIGTLKQRVFDLDKTLKASGFTSRLTMPKSKKRLRLGLLVLGGIGALLIGFFTFDVLNDSSPSNPSEIIEAPNDNSPMDNPPDPSEDLNPGDTVDDGEVDDETTVDDVSDPNTPTAIGFKVVFIGMNDEIIFETVVTSSDILSPPTPPGIEGFVFKNWDTQIETINQDTEINAIYHSIPRIIGPSKISIDLNRPFDILSYFNIVDAIDENIMESVNISNDGTITTPGKTFVTISAQNNQGEKTIRNIEVVAYEDPPQITGLNTVYLPVGEEFNPMEGVQAIDSIDGNITSLIEVTGTFDFMKSGSYQLNYSVRNGGNIVTESTRTVYYSEPINGQNAVPSSSNRFQFFIDEDVRLSVDGFNDLTNSILDLPIPTKPGYVFEGWTLNGRVLPPDEILSESNYQLQASWHEDNFGFVIFNGQPLEYLRTFTSNDYTGNIELGLLQNNGHANSLPDTSNHYAYIMTIDLSLREFEIPQFIHNRYVNGLYLRNDWLPFTGPEIILRYYDNLRSISIPETLNGSVVVMAFNMYEINVHPNNQTYTVIDNVLYSKSISILYLYPQGITQDEYLLPDSVHTIITQGFYHVRNLRRIATNPSTQLSNLQRFSFFHMWDLDEITLPQRVSSLLNDAFIFSELDIDVIYHD